MVPELLTNVPLSGAVLPQVTVPVTELPEPSINNDPYFRSTSVLPPEYFLKYSQPNSESFKA